MPPINVQIAIGAAFAVGLMLFAAGTALVRSSRRAAAGITWPLLVDDAVDTLGEPLRLDMIERLMLLGTPWSRTILERARTEEREPKLAAAIERALR